jgi:hypothetical protein
MLYDWAIAFMLDVGNDAQEDILVKHICFETTYGRNPRACFIDFDWYNVKII